MRKKVQVHNTHFKIFVIDDEQGIIDSLQVVLSRLGHEIHGVTDPLQGIEHLKTNHYDLLILDFLMDSLRGDIVVEKIREFNPNLFILMLTGHQDVAPPLQTMQLLDIQGYCEKSDKFDQLILYVESARKTIRLKNQNLSFETNLQGILHALPKIYQLQPLPILMQNILQEAIQIAHCENAFLMLEMEGYESQPLFYHFHGMGSFADYSNATISVEKLPFSENISALILAIKEMRKPIFLEDEIIFPLIDEENIYFGCLYLTSKAHSHTKVLLEIFAKQASSSLRNISLHEMLAQKKESMKQSLHTLKENTFEMMEALRLAVDAKDMYTRGHSDRVAFFSQEMGIKMGLSKEDINLLFVGGQFHDIGKIGIPDGILTKNGALTNEEFHEIKKHPQKGESILSTLSVFKKILPMVRSHHERMDGRGYPDGLAGEQIPLLARIICVADAFDAMTSNRHYRSKISFDDAVTQLLENAGTQFDPHIVQIFSTIVSEQKFHWQKLLEPTYQGISADLNVRDKIKEVVFI